MMSRTNSLSPHALLIASLLLAPGCMKYDDIGKGSNSDKDTSTSEVQQVDGNLLDVSNLPDGQFGLDGGEVAGLDSSEVADASHPGELPDMSDPPDTTDTFDSDTLLVDSGETTDLVDDDTGIVDLGCIPDCDGRECGDDGCGGTCWASDGDECSDGDSCTTDSCGDGKCQHEGLPDGSECEDDEPCWLGDSCLSGVCESGEVLNTCDDGNDCTEDSCKPQVGCKNVVKEDGTECTDNSVCTMGDICSGGVCVVGPPMECGDVYPCTADLCDPQMGCTNDLAPECVHEDDDFDNDGILNIEDKCPFAFDPGNPDLNDIPGPDACESLADHGQFAGYVEVSLHAGGEAPSQRRTHEPATILLANGRRDEHLNGAWDMVDGEAAQTVEPASEVETFESISATEGVFPDGSQAMAFNGTTSFIEDSEKYPSGSEITTMMWFRVDGNESETQALISASPEVANDPTSVWYGLNLRIGSSCSTLNNQPGVKETHGEWGRLYFSLGKDDYCMSLGTSFQVTDGNWHHVAAVMAGTTMSLHVDGALVISYKLSSGMPSGTKTTLGALEYRQGWEAEAEVQHIKHFNGAMDDVIVLNRALSTQEIYEYYNSSAPYGTALVGTPYGDYSDIRLTELPGLGETGPEVVKRMKVYVPQEGEYWNPHIRFLANTTVHDQDPGEGTSFPARTYRVYSGKSIAPPPSLYVPSIDGSSCNGLFNECLGYVSYYPLDGSLWDWSTNGYDLEGATSPSGFDYVQGASGTGLTLKAGMTNKCVPNDFGDADPPVAITAEGTFRHKSLVTGSTNVHSSPGSSFHSNLNNPVLTWEVQTTDGYKYAELEGLLTQTMQAVRGVATDTSLALYIDELSVSAESAPLALGGDYWKTCIAGDSNKGLVVDEVRLMNRALPVDEFLHYPRLIATAGPTMGCVADCAYRECGYDGCTGNCGFCSGEDVCDIDLGICVPPGYALAPPGEFEMGYTGGGCGDEESTTVTIKQPFLIGLQEVTQGTWKDLVYYSTPSYHHDDKLCVSGSNDANNCPLDRVNLYQALNLCNKMSLSEGFTACYELNECPNNFVETCTNQFCTFDTCASATFAGNDCDGYRLPTPAEWEYAARAGTVDASYPYPTPDGTNLDLCDSCEDFAELIPYLNCDCSAYDKTVRSDYLEPNNWGLTEMVGNLHELTSPWANDPALEVFPNDNVTTRGGAFNDDCFDTTSAATMTIDANDKRYDTGFRVVRSVGLVE
jgi:formylglycine-generating enzyme required for sulfatase activity